MILTTERIWQEFSTPLKRFILKRIANEQWAEDILQDVFVKIHTHVGTLKEQDKLQSWLYQIARNAIYDYYRGQKATVDIADIFDFPEESSDDDVEHELAPCIKKMVNDLPDVYREALILTEYQGLTQKELAERCGLSFSGAKSRVQRARERLKGMLLECCHFEFDRRGGIVDFQPRCECCMEESRCGFGGCGS